MASTNLDPGAAEHVLANLGWIQALARRLVSDPALADDLAQEACVVALERRPRDEGNVRRWLASVLRNLVRQRQRSDGRRRRREEHSARAEATSSTAELVEEVSVQRALVERVLELDEPYRSTVLLRYFRDLPPREIARLQGVPVNTVQSRLKRAHDKLRQRLDKSYGSRATWSVCFAPLALAKDANLLAAPTLGITLMKLKVALVAVAIAAVGAATLWMTDRAAPSAATPRGLAGPAALVPTPESELTDERPGGKRAVNEERTPVVVPASPAVAAEARPVPVGTTRLVQGRVLDGGGQPVAGVALGLRTGGDVLARSDAGGGFRFESELPEGVLVAADEGWVTVREGVWKRGSAVQAAVVIAPAIELSGRVIDERGSEAPGAAVTFRLPGDFRNRFATILEGSRLLTWSVRSEDDGSFRLAGVPGLEGASLLASLDGYLPASLDAPLQDANGLRLVLSRPEAPLEGRLAGRVVDASGAGVPGARVALGLTSVLSGDDGGFAIDLARAVTSERLTAIKAGFRPVTELRPGEPRVHDDGTHVTGWPDFVVLALREPALRVSGLVVDHEGEPKSGVKVWIDDPTPFAPIGLAPANVEGLAAGGEIPAHVLESRAHLPEADGESYWDWRSDAGPSSALWTWRETDAEGRFELSGLDDRRYRLALFDEDTLSLTKAPDVRAGDEGLVLELDAPRRAERLAGRVVTERGQPVPDANLTLWIPLVERGSRIRGGYSDVILTREGARGKTDDAGGFAFADAPLENVRIEVAGSGIVPTTFALAEEDDPTALELVVSVRCHLTVELREDTQRADAIAFRTADDEPLDVLIISDNATNAYTSAALVAGSSGVVSVSSAARTLQLLREGEVVEEHPLDLRPGELNELRL